MKNKNYPQMFDEKIISSDFLDSLHDIAETPLSYKFISTIRLVRAIPLIIIGIFYMDTMVQYILNIYYSYLIPINGKLATIQTATAYAKNLAAYLIN